MNDEIFLEKGAAAFGFWAGMQDIFYEPLRFLCGISGGLKEKISRIGRNIYSPPDENMRLTDGEYLKASTDDLFFDVAREMCIAPAPFWPDRAPYAVCLTHDIDRIRLTYQLAASKLRRKDLRGALRALPRAFQPDADPYNNLQRIEQYEKEWGIRSALYVLFERKRFKRAILKGELQHVLGVYNPEDIAEKLRKLYSQGFEIGLHGSFDAFNDKRSLSSELKRLSVLLGIGEASLGVRNHYLQFDRDRTPRIQKENGILYDSTIGFNFICGFRCKTTFPFPIFTKAGEFLIELPLNIMDTALKFCAPGKEAEIADCIVEEVRKRGGLLMINWHQHFCNKEIDPIMYDWIERVILCARRDGAYISRPVDAAAYWANRVGMREAVGPTGNNNAV